MHLIVESRPHRLATPVHMPLLTDGMEHFDGHDLDSRLPQRLALSAWVGTRFLRALGCGDGPAASWTATESPRRLHIPSTEVFTGSSVTPPVRQNG
jgi:hypothetical protein